MRRQQSAGNAPLSADSGAGRVATDEVERHAFWNDMLASTFTGPDDPKYCVIVIEPYRIEYCTQGSFEPEVWTR